MDHPDHNNGGNDMKAANGEIIKAMDLQAEKRRQAILNAPDTAFEGTAYYVRADGDDAADGRTPEHAWKTLDKVSSFPLLPGSVVRFQRGDLFRGQLFCKPGVTYAAFGEGPKPRLYGWTKSLCDPKLWERVPAPFAIYHLKEKMPDCGTLVFNDGLAHSRKLIPTWKDGGFVCREQPDKPFDFRTEMTENLDIFCHCTAVMSNRESHGQTFPIPDMLVENCGDLYLRCDAGNPGEVFSQIEALPRRNIISVGNCDHVRIDNLCVKYGGAHGIGAGGLCIKGLHVTNCEIGWIGGGTQHYLALDPNYTLDPRGAVTRYGNGIEIYGGCEDYLCADNYLYQIYDAALTHQYTIDKNHPAASMSHVRYTGNLVEYSVYPIEYWLTNTAGSDCGMSDIEIDHNIFRLTGYGWGQQRHNNATPSHIKSWMFDNPATNYTIHDNVFDRSKYRLLHLCCRDAASAPKVYRNTYVQTLGNALGQYGSWQNRPVPVYGFFEDAEEVIRDVFGDTDPTVWYVR